MKSGLTAAASTYVPMKSASFSYTALKACQVAPLAVLTVVDVGLEGVVVVGSVGPVAEGRCSNVVREALLGGGGGGGGVLIAAADGALQRGRVGGGERHEGDEERQELRGCGGREGRTWKVSDDAPRYRQSSKSRNVVAEAQSPGDRRRATRWRGTRGRRGHRSMGRTVHLDNFRDWCCVRTSGATRTVAAVRMRRKKSRRSFRACAWRSLGPCPAANDSKTEVWDGPHIFVQPTENIGQSPTTTWRFNSQSESPSRKSGKEISNPFLLYKQAFAC